MNRLALLAMAVAACGDADPTTPAPDTMPTPGGFTVTGTADGAPAGGKLMVLWEVTSGADALIKFGDAPAAKSFTLSFAKDPPPQAINANGVAVGIVAMYDAIDVPADGANLDEATLDALEPHLRGFGDFVEIVWRGAGTGTPPAWSSQFPDGYACGRCVLKRQGEIHDSFAPTTCDVTVIDAETEHICNWQ